jgi:lipopolysaccharide/colanic/teichoic acid biosynthesis glycosyltransferase
MPHDESTEEDARVIYLEARDGEARSSGLDTNETHVIYLDDSASTRERSAAINGAQVGSTHLDDVDIVSPALVILSPQQQFELEEAIEDDDGESAYTRWGKRLLDIVVVTISAPLWLPLYAVAALVLLCAEGRPIHYWQPRVGKDGTHFSILKFRTMHSNADSELMEMLLRDPGLDREYRSTVKLRSDPRVTKIGAFYRRWSIDELPQLWNVLAGQMSLIGPRPVREGEWMNCYGALAPLVFRLPPGMTGLWQTRRTSFTTYEERVFIDGTYSVACSLVTDIAILGATIPSLIGGDGSF